jgi:lipid II:glycine glycyltransferase (peptidoglycan interpeptide bridge formation enzyme)
MQVRILSTPEDLRAYDQWIKTHPQGSLWQSLEWKGYQEALGREVRVYILEEAKEARESKETREAFAASALVVIDRTKFGLSTWDIPRGPLGTMTNDQLPMTNALLDKIVEDAKEDRCMSLYLSPSKHLLRHCATALQPSKRLLMPSATRIIDLTKSEEEILAQMKPKGRYNISVAERHGVQVKRSEDIDGFLKLLKTTARRHGFIPSPSRHYEAFIHHLEGSYLLLAYHPTCLNLPISGLLGVVWAQTGTYYYGASDEAHRAKMAPYLLQWGAMKWCRSQGCRKYDLFGVAPQGARYRDRKVPGTFVHQWEGPSQGARYRDRKVPGTFVHQWEGLSRFKSQFGGEVLMYPLEQEVRLRPVATFVLRWKRRLVG